MVLALLCLGCTHRGLARRLVRAPNLQVKAAPYNDVLMVGLADFHVVLPGSSQASAITVQARVLEPGDWQFAYSFLSERTVKEHKVAIELSYKKPERFVVQPKGTILLLHGFGQRKEQMLHWGLSLAQQGYRCVLVDLRGHGGSSGPWVGFGAFEAEDLRAFLDALAEHHLVAGKVGVLGVSLGATVALQWAGLDPRGASVVALEPFADPQAAIHTMVQNFGPFRRSLWWATAATIEQAIREAPEQAGFRWADVDVLKAVGQIHGPVLFLHGAKDKMVPPEHSERLCLAAPAGSRLWLLPDEDHITLALRLEGLDGVVQGWFKERLVD
jgi:pimeloyl-ACP methyl ester carboxylesterase